MRLSHFIFLSMVATIVAGQNLRGDEPPVRELRFVDGFAIKKKAQKKPKKGAPKGAPKAPKKSPEAKAVAKAEEEVGQRWLRERERERERGRRISQYILHHNLRNDKLYTENGGR